jgi:uncharacterized lipoprotein YehR (DUF1307 family)
MKKIICLLLAVICVVGLVSCGEKAPVDEIIEKSDPTKITTMVSYIGEDTLNGTYVNEIDGNKSKFTYEFERRALVSEMNDGKIKTVSGAIYYKDGKISKNEGDSWEEVATGAGNYKLNLAKENFKSYEYTEDGNSVNAVLAEDKAQDVLGVAIDTDGDITVKITTNGTYLYGVDISYTSADGASVTIRTSYTYSPVTLDF